MSKLRIGNGYDVHAFAEGRELILGGVKIAHDKGLAGHSDADVLLHAVIDALLGALALGDIGSWFPDTDAEFKDIDSKILLSKVWEKIKGDGWSIVNLDTTVIAQKPKLRLHIDTIRESIANELGLEIADVSVKATTSEKLGFVGREEGIAASATVLLKS